MTVGGRLGRVLRAAAATCLLGAAGVAFVVPPAAGEDVPVEAATVEAEAYLAQYGWWNKAQQAPAQSSPVPKPPSAPDDGLYVAQEYEGAPSAVPVAGPSVGGAVGGIGGAVPTVPPGTPAGSPPSPGEQVLGPTAYSAVRFVVPDGAESEVTLQLLNRAPVQPGGVDPLVGALAACPTSSSWDATQNGRYDQAPSFDCTAAAAGQVGGDSVTFTLPSTFVNSGTLDFVVIPTGAQPFQVGMAPPTDASLTILNADQLVGEEEFSAEDFAFEDPLTEFSEAETFDDAGFADTSFTSDFDATTFDAPTTRVVRRTPTARPTRTATPAAAFRNPFDPEAGRTQRLVAVGILLAMGAALWWLGGQPTRAPRLLGSLGAGAMASGGPVATSDSIAAKGIGRFARPRGAAAGKPPRLF